MTMPDWMKNPILLGIANKVAYTAAAWFVHRGWVAGDQQSQAENVIVGVVLGALSWGWTCYTTHHHDQQNKVVAQLATSNPLAVLQAQINVNSKTPNGLP